MVRKTCKKLIDYASISAIFMGLAGSILPPAQANEQRTETLTPIKHVIIVIGENRSFDHIWGTYKPLPGQTISNILSKGIVNADGTPGSNFSEGTQFQSSVTSTFLLSHNGSPYTILPPPKTGGAPTSASDTAPPPFETIGAVDAFNNEFGIYLPSQDFGVLTTVNEPNPQDAARGLLTTGATGLPARVIDTRITNAANLPNGPFQLTNPTTHPYDTYDSSPVHRFYQAWQQADCDISHATKDKPSGCINGLFSFVETTIAAGTNGQGPSAFANGEGSTALGFYNVSQGDVPYFKELADNYALADNYHQPVMGGTGANSIMTGFGDALWYSDGNGNATTPPTNQIENPNPQSGTNNLYTQDGYSGGTFSNCSDSSQPGVGPILNFLGSLPYKPKPNCAPGHYYLLNN